MKDRKLHNSTTQGNSQIVLQEGIYLKVPDTVSVNQPFSVKKKSTFKVNISKIFFLFPYEGNTSELCFVITGYWHTMVCSFLISDTKDYYCEYYYSFI